MRGFASGIDRCRHRFAGCSRCRTRLNRSRSSNRDLITRRDLEELLGVSRSRAAALMRVFGAELAGTILVLQRGSLLRTFQQAISDGSFTREIERRDRFVQYLRQARTAAVRVPVVPSQAPRRMDGLPPGVTGRTWTHRGRFEDPREALSALYSLAQALLADYDRFEDLVRR